MIATSGFLTALEGSTFVVGRGCPNPCWFKRGLLLRRGGEGIGYGMERRGGRKPKYKHASINSCIHPCSLGQLQHR